MSIKNKVNDLVWDVKYGSPKDKTKAVLTVASFAADAVSIATGVGTGVKVAQTASKLAKCGKGTKMIATFTMNAQKSNITKATNKIASCQAGKVLSKLTKNKL